MGSRKLILVLDDDMSVLGAVERLLKAREFDVESFLTIDSFMQRANLREAACLVLDINLNGFSGIELKRKLTDTGISPPVIFITARDEDVTRRAALSAGCVAYLSKPFSSRDLVEAIEAASQKPNSGLPVLVLAAIAPRDSGSSGGSAAALAAGLSSLEIGSDVARASAAMRRACAILSPAGGDKCPCCFKIGTSPSSGGLNRRLLHRDNHGCSAVRSGCFCQPDESLASRRGKRALKSGFPAIGQVRARINFVWKMAQSAAARRATREAKLKQLRPGDEAAQSPGEVSALAKSSPRAQHTAPVWTSGYIAAERRRRRSRAIITLNRGQCIGRLVPARAPLSSGGPWPGWAHHSFPSRALLPGRLLRSLPARCPPKRDRLGPPPLRAKPPCRSLHQAFARLDQNRLSCIPPPPLALGVGARDTSSVFQRISAKGSATSFPPRPKNPPVRTTTTAAWSRPVKTSSISPTLTWSSPMTGTPMSFEARSDVGAIAPTASALPRCSAAAATLDFPLSPRR